MEGKEGGREREFWCVGRLPRKEQLATDKGEARTLLYIHCTREGL